jgi:hypothetical protein
MIQPMKTISFADAYGLNLIASNPQTPYRANIVKRLSPEAQEIAKAIKAPVELTKKETSTGQNLPTSDKTHAASEQ